MATKITVSENGSFFVDGVSKNITDLTQDFLEKLVEDSLGSKVEYEVQGEMPIAKFFRTLDEGTKEGSELRRLKEQAEKKATEEQEAGRQFVDNFSNGALEQINEI